MSDERQSWDEYFMSLARAAATRATCPRKSVGAVIVRDRTVLSTGYNGSVRGAPHCIDVGCIIEHNHCIATVHAEVNAILQAAKNGASTSFSTIYVTSNPCLNCMKAIINAGIKRVVYDEIYRPVDYDVLKVNNNQMLIYGELKKSSNQ